MSINFGTPDAAQDSAEAWQVAMHATQGAGDIGENLFSGNGARDAGGIYRTGSSGSMAGNRGLTSDAIGEINPK